MENIWNWINEWQSDIIFGLGIAVVILLFLVIVLLIQQVLIRKRFRTYESGSLNATLEEELKRQKNKIKVLEEELEEEKKRVSRFMMREKKALKKVKLIKYNAFATQGGNVSYAIALLNEENDGVVLNSIHSTDFSFSYAKEVKNGEVKQVMSKEEQSVLQKALEA